MSNDSFFREVNEEIRQDQAKALWDRYGAFVIGLAVAIVLGTAAFVGYEYWTGTQASRSGDEFAKALALANEGKDDDALAAFAALEKEGYGAYPVLARMRAATVLVDKGDTAGAVSAFDAIANDNSVMASLRDIARLRAGMVLVDNGSYADVAKRVEQLATDANPFRHSARELLGLSAWKEGRAADALKLFEQIVADGEAPRGTRERAALLVELIRGSGNAS
ncbi:membrane protein [Mesorhizobium sp. L-8-10]|uniref:tetratricopeptide repeat protein n=1 Tax=Mesorhizobium sp. L-8-10 TaxID=2744523 RepID=UPI0019295429|nr:tetratricopeptide repeat protein [Mesorhizobium sp. L-8-10]BCH34221.1 membrane protein [Mesorhizobium sp. L-8-10]